MSTPGIQSNRASGRAHQRGVTLVELLIGTAIGLFLTAGIVALFASTRQSYRATEAMSRLQENGRHAVEYLSREIRQTGYRDILNTTTPALSDAIQGWSGAATDPSTESLPAYTANTDVLRVRYAQAGSSPAIIQSRVFYVAPGANGAPALWQRAVATQGATVLSTQVAELFGDVYDTQVRYGIDTDNDRQINSYTTTVTNWGQVVAAKLDLLLGSTEGNLADSPMSLPYRKNDGTFFSAGDRRLYQMFSTTIALRNRLP